MSQPIEEGDEVPQVIQQPVFLGSDRPYRPYSRMGRRGRIPYAVYKAAQATAREARIQENAADLVRFKTNLDKFMHDYGISDGTYQNKFVGDVNKYQSRMLHKVLGRGKYSLMRLGRDAKRLVGNRITTALEDRIVRGISGQGLYSGRGAYNSLFSEGDPSMNIGGSGDETETIVIQHCEYLQDVYGAPDSNFHNEGWKLNPALMENFPWLSQIAANYEEYEFIQLVFTYKATVEVQATNNSTGGTGTIIMATNYNPVAPIFSNKETMMQYHGAQSGRIVEDHVHGVECDPATNAGSSQKYTRTNPVILGQDPKTFDLGTFQLAQVNIPEAFYNQQIGELWVYYTVRLTKPRLFTALGSDIPEWRLVSNKNITGGTQTITNVFGTNNSNNKLNALYMQQNNIPIRIQYLSLGQYLMEFPDFITGVFEVQFFATVSCTSVSATNNVWINAVNITGNVQRLYDLYGVGATSSVSVQTPGYMAPACQMTTTSEAQALAIFRFYITPVVGGQDNTVQFGMQLPTLGGSNQITQSQIVVRQVNPNLAAFETTGNYIASGAPVYVDMNGIPQDVSNMN